MSSMKELETEIVRLRREIEVLKDIESIKQLKAKYFRCVDSKLWDDLADCFTDDATTSYSGGKFKYQGKEAIMKFLKEGLGGRITMHQGHHPEIEVTGETTAVGTWALEDYVVTQTNTGQQCAAFYHDEYVKVDGMWKIKYTGYDFIFRQVWDRNETRSLKITHKMQEPPPVTS